MPSKNKTDRFNKIISKHLEGKATPEELAFLEKYYHYFEQQPDFTDSLTPDERLQMETRMLNYLKAEINKAETPGLVPIRWKWFGRMMAAAVTILIMLSGVVYLWTKNEKKQLTVMNKNPPAVKHDAAPGGNKAIIKLDDGSTITLDSTANGTIAQQGGSQIIKLSNGAVAYQPKQNANLKVLMNTLSTPRGGQYQLTLADGTKVWLNAASSITYPTAFIEKERKVKITGEVYFEVAPLLTEKGLVKVPFIVEATTTGRLGEGDMEVQVLGTHFNVNTYADEGASTTTLLEGLVRIKNKNEIQMLKPGQQAVIKNNIKVKGDMDMDAVMAWKNGYFSFNNTGLQTVMKQLSRWYDVEVSYEGAMPDMKFWGGISMGSNLSEVLKVLEESKVNFRIENKKIIVFPKSK